MNFSDSSPGGWNIMYSVQKAQCWCSVCQNAEGSPETCAFPSVHIKLYSELGWGASSISRMPT